MNEQVSPNPYVNEYFKQTQKKEKKETPITAKMKTQFSFFGTASAVYALFYAFCLYRNASGITYPFFVAGTLCYFFLSMKKLGVPYKKDSLFYVISILLLGISNCCTSSIPLLWMNKLGIFLLTFILILHTVYSDREWNFPKYIGAILLTVKESISCLLCPVRDMASFYNAQNKEKGDADNAGHKNYFLYILLGVAISIPILAIMIILLSSADIVFQNLLKNIFSIDFYFTDIFKILLLITVVFFSSYALLASLCKKTVKEETSDKRILEPVIGITVTGMLSVVYLLFSIIQIFYLFIGNMQLPDGYTYSAYARQGFFQLLAVCILNLLLVLFCINFFKENMILKIILTVISGCTFIMIFSSALRMFMYISRYNLTFLRIFVLWALAVIFLLMIGVTIYIYFQRFPLFFYSVAVTTVFYIGLSFAHPDYWIAAYNLHPSHTGYLDEYDVADSLRYLSRLSADAAPILLDESKNPYLSMKINEMKLCTELEKDNTSSVSNSALYYYYKKIYMDSGQMNIRNFNFSIYYAKKSAGL